MKMKSWIACMILLIIIACNKKNSIEKYYFKEGKFVIYKGDTVGMFLLMPDAAGKFRMPKMILQDPKVRFKCKGVSLFATYVAFKKEQSFEADWNDELMWVQPNDSIIRMDTLK